MKRRAFSLVELLLALALSAMLLAAVAVAMDASFTSSDQNDRIADTTQTARAVLGRIAHDIRTANDLQPTATTISIHPPQPNAYNLALIQYAYANGALTESQTDNNGVVTTTTLLDNTGDVKITGFAVTFTMGLDSNLQPCTRSVTAHLTVTDGNQQFGVTASASPRRNQTY